MHRNKHKEQAAKPPETREASEAVKELTAHTLAEIDRLLGSLGAVALRDAKLDPAHGWRYDAIARRFVKVDG